MNSSVHFIGIDFPQTENRLSNNLSYARTNYNQISFFAFPEFPASFILSPNILLQWHNRWNVYILWWQTLPGFNVMCPFLFTAILELSIGPGGSERHKNTVIKNAPNISTKNRKTLYPNIQFQTFEFFGNTISKGNDLPMSLPLTKPSHSRNHCMLIQYITTGDSSSWNALLN